MNTPEIIITVFLVALGTAFSRFLPFLIFRDGSRTPRTVTSLGRTLPGAVFAMLVIYCLRNVGFSEVGQFLPELVAVLSVVGVHLAFRKTLLSVFLGTSIYIVLVNFIFV